MGPMRPIDGTGIWSGALRFGDPGMIAAAAAELDELGYSVLWIPDVGGDVFGSVDLLLNATRDAAVATGVLNLWMHTPEETAAGYERIRAAHGDRFLVGIGVGHAAHVDAQQPGRYRRPLEAMARFLDGVDAADPALPRDRRVLAALGPKMLALAKGSAAGVHPYNVTPVHTARARQLLGPDALVLPEQAVVLSKDADAARRIGREHVRMYLSLPNYSNNLRRLGFDDDDFTGGGSDRLVDALVVWGDETTIAARVDEHRQAGANHVCIQVLSDEQPFPLTAWRELAPALVQGTQR
jgi:probable F420-dependent oxidoreductase